MRLPLLLLAIAAPGAASAADSSQTFRLVQDPANMASCLRLAPQFEREHTLTVSGDSVRVSAPGGLSERMKPVKPGDRIKVRLTCREKSLRADKGWGEVTWDTEITNQAGETVAAYHVLTMVSVHAIPDRT